MAILWHVRHMADPTATTSRSIMPPFPWLLTDTLDYGHVQANVDAMAMLGVPYGDAINHAKEMAKAQAKAPARSLVSIDDVGKAVAFLALDGAKLMTGDTIYIDGGYHIID